MSTDIITANLVPELWADAYLIMIDQPNLSVDQLKKLAMTSLSRSEQQGSISAELARYVGQDVAALPADDAHDVDYASLCACQPILTATLGQPLASLLAKGYSQTDAAYHLSISQPAVAQKIAKCRTIRL